MKTLSLTSIALVLTALLPVRGLSQPSFDSGSDGSSNALNVAVDTVLLVPPDGKFNYTTIAIQAGKTLSFTRNAFNTPVYLLAQGDVIINGTISLNGQDGTAGLPGAGGPGGFDGGKPGVGGAPPGAGQGPGAGKGGSAGAAAGAPASYGSLGIGSSTGKGVIYGNALLMPLVGGSGGGGTASSTVGVGGGGGAGAILIASNTKIQFGPASGGGAVNAIGGGGSVAFGSGGGIRLVAPTVDLLSAGQHLNVNSASGPFNPGGFGRIRIDSLNLLYSGPSALVDPSVATFGSMMLVFPNPLPHLDILQAAGTAIAEGNPSPVTIVLPPNADPNRTVTVQARDFNRPVDIKVVLTPDSGDPVEYPGQNEPPLTIDNTAGHNPAQIVVIVTLPINIRATVSAWRR